VQRFAYVGVFLVALSTLMLEILLTRVTSVVAWYHLAFFVISLAMLGMTAGAVWVFVRPESFPQTRVNERMTQATLAFAIVTPISIGLALAMPLYPVNDLMGFLGLLAFAGPLIIPFVLSGIALTLALTRAGLPPGLVYGVDLVGAAMGCVLVIPTLGVVDAASAIAVAAALAGAAALAFAVASGGRRAGPAIVTLTMVWIAWANATAETPALRPIWSKGTRENPGDFSWLDWNTYSRVTVANTVVAAPVLWAAGRNTPPHIMGPRQQREIRIDGAAATMMVELGPGPDQHEYLDWDVTAFAHRLRPNGPAAVIGVGGGRDVLEAIRAGHEHVLGIELNDLILDLHRQTMPEFSGVATLPGVELVADEARSYMAREQRKFRVITMSLIDTWASTGAGAYSLSENGLYTVEGWKTFMSRLDSDGIFTVSRWYKVNSPGETARMLALAMETLWEVGAKEPRNHIILLQVGNIATILVSPQPFSNDDLDLMQKHAVRMGLNMILTPRKRPQNPTLAALADQPSRAAMWAWTQSQPLDLTPTTDDRPFFFNMLKPGTWLTREEEIDRMDLSFLGNLQATQTLVYATLVSLLLTVLAIVIPLWSRRRDLHGYAPGELGASCGYFALIGVGFMLVEIGLLSRLNVYLGHPTLALAVLLAGIIFFTGIGSMSSSRVPVERALVARMFPLVPALLVLVASLVLNPAMHATGSSGIATRVLVSLALIGPPALGLGLAFPLGLRLVTRLRGEHRADLGPWLWGINGAFGVCASGLALGCSMAFGVSTTLILGALAYLWLPLCTNRLVRPSQSA